MGGGGGILDGGGPGGRGPPGGGGPGGNPLGGGGIFKGGAPGGGPLGGGALGGGGIPGGGIPGAISISGRGSEGSLETSLLSVEAAEAGGKFSCIRGNGLLDSCAALAGGPSSTGLLACSDGAASMAVGGG